MSSNRMETFSDGVLARAVGADLKGQVSLALYAVAIPCAFLSQWIAGLLFVAVAVMWLVPDRRIEEAVPAPSEPFQAPAAK